MKLLFVFLPSVFYYKEVLAKNLEGWRENYFCPPCSEQARLMSWSRRWIGGPGALECLLQLQQSIVVALLCLHWWVVPVLAKALENDPTGDKASFHKVQASHQQGPWVKLRERQSLSPKQKSVESPFYLFLLHVVSNYSLTQTSTTPNLPQGQQNIHPQLSDTQQHMLRICCVPSHAFSELPVLRVEEKKGGWRAWTE